MKLFVDDIRDIPEGWLCVRNYMDAIATLSLFVVEELSLDHDLGEEKTGYDIACWIEEKAITSSWVPPKIKVHSANPVGRARILQVIESIERNRRTQ